jgi:hypothetical protein
MRNSTMSAYVARFWKLMIGSVPYSKNIEVQLALPLI